MEVLYEAETSITGKALVQPGCIAVLEKSGKICFFGGSIIREIFARQRLDFFISDKFVRGRQIAPDDDEYISFTGKDFINIVKPAEGA